MRSTTSLDYSTRAVRTHDDGLKANRPLSPPFVLATTAQARSSRDHGRLYSEGTDTFYPRFGNPTTSAAARKIADLEGAEEALVFASGMAAITTAVMAVVRAGDHIVSHHEVFAQTRVLLERLLPAYGVETSFVDARTPDAVGRAMRPSTRLVYLETPSNPLLHVLDVAAVAAEVRAAGGSTELFVDSTFASPVVQNPLRLGATLVLHSGTKFPAGHSDVMCGAAAGGRELVRRVREAQYIFGGVMDPHAAWLLLRGLQTLDVRVRRQCESALALARHLRDHPAVTSVRYPLLEGTPGHDVARRQMRGGGVISFAVQEGVEGARAVADALELIPIAPPASGAWRR